MDGILADHFNVHPFDYLVVLVYYPSKKLKFGQLPCLQDPIIDQ